MRISFRRRTAVCVTTALMIALAASAGAAASPAQASVLTAFCTGSMATTLDPGLRLFTQTISTENDFVYSPCVSSDPSLTHGTSSFDGEAEFSCIDLPASFDGAKTIYWNNGHTSTFSFTSTFTTVAGEFVTTNTGTITAGQFAGHTALEIILGATPDLLMCLFPPGITSRTSFVALEIT